MINRLVSLKQRCAKAFILFGEAAIGLENQYRPEPPALLGRLDFSAALPEVSSRQV